MRRAEIVAPVRTPVGSFGGSLRQVRAEGLAAQVIEAVIDRSGVEISRRWSDISEMSNAESRGQAPSKP